MKTKLYLFLILIISINIAAQKKEIKDSIDCSKLRETDIAVSKLPEPLKSFAEVQNDFLKKIDTAIFNSTIYIKVYIDTLGNVHCSRILKGCNNKLDTIAMDYVKGIKFQPAMIRDKKINIFIAFPLYGNQMKETHDMIRKNGKWYKKSNNKKGAPNKAI